MENNDKQRKLLHNVATTTRHNKKKKISESFRQKEISNECETRILTNVGNVGPIKNR